MDQGSPNTKPPIPTPPNYFGAVDIISDEFVSGYAINLRDVSRQPAVQVFLNDQLIGSGVCDLFRDDLLRMGVADGKCGFLVSIGEPVLDVALLRVVISGDYGPITLPLNPSLLPMQRRAASSTVAGRVAVVRETHPSVTAESHQTATLDKVDSNNFKSRREADQLWSAQKWGDAQATYLAYVGSVRDDAIAWRRIAECAMALGDFTNAEGACRVAILLAANDATHHLLHGDILKALTRLKEAGDSYLQSFALSPTRVAAVRAEALGRFPMLPSKVDTTRQPLLCLEISDLLHVMCEQKYVSGIQRVQLGLVSYVLGTLGKPNTSTTPLVIWLSDRLYEVSSSSLTSLIETIAEVDVDLKERSNLVHRLQDESILFAFAPGDIVLLTGASWRPEIRSDVARGHVDLRKAGVRLGLYLYDFIPLTDPSFCHPYLTERFSVTLSEALLHCDFALTISDYVAAELQRLLLESGYSSIPIKTVPLAHSFGTHVKRKAVSEGDWSPAIADLQGMEFVLSVSSLSAHKNHLLLVQAWSLLIQSGIKLPLLVIVGKRGFGSEDLFRQLETSQFLDGHIRVHEDLEDDALSHLYDKCLFTMFPSFTEGWGLPVGESLVHGKLCVASSTTSIPEVGGDFVIYIDPYNARGCAEIVADLLADRNKIRKYEKRLQNGFRARTWDEFGATLISTAWKLGRSKRLERQQLALTLGSVVMPHGSDSGWSFGTRLPPYETLARTVLSRAILVFGWSKPGPAGAYMTGEAATLILPVAAEPGERVSILLQLRATASARLRVRVVANTSIAEASSAVFERSESDLLLRLDAAVDPTGHVELWLKSTQGPVPAEWLARLSIVRLVVLALSEQLDALPENYLLRTTALVGEPGRAVAPNSGHLLVAAIRRRAVLQSGWLEPEAARTWADGSLAHIGFATEAAPDSEVRVVIRLCGRAGARLRVTATSWCGAKAIVSPADNELSDFMLWMVCKVDDKSRIAIDLRAADPETPAGCGARLAISGLAYGRQASALAEALLFAPQERDLQHEILQNGIRFIVTGHFKGSYSLASVNRRLAVALEAYRPGSVKIEQVEGSPTRDLTQMLEVERSALIPLASRSRHEDGPLVVIAQHWPVLDQVSIADLPLAYVFWEEGLAPRDMVQRLNATYAGVLVPARSVAKALIDSGLSRPVRTIGMAPELHAFLQLGVRRAAEAPRQPTLAEPFTFLHVSSCFPRKGADVLLEAFAKAFRKDDPVRLILKTFPNPHNDVDTQLAALIARDVSAPNITLTNKDLPFEKMLALYATADAMVLPTRGEGFNLPAAEAMAAGLSLIVTDFGGQADFVDAAVSRTIDYRFALSRSHLNSPGSVWVDPDVDDLAGAMREIFINARTPDALARIEASRGIAMRLADANAWAERITEAAANLLCAPQSEPPRVALITTWNIRCGVAEYSRLLVDAYPAAVRDIVILCNEDEPMSESDQAALPLVRVAWRNLHHESMERLVSAIEDSNARVILIQYHLALIAPLSLAMLLTSRNLRDRHIVITIHNVQDLFKDLVTNSVLIPALASVSRILVHTVRDLNLLKAQGLIENVTMFPHGVSNRGPSASPARLLPATTAPLIGAYGFLLPHKGVSKLIEAFAALRSTWPLARLRLVTAEYPNPVSAAELSHCRRLVTEFGLDDVVEWITEFLPDERSLALLNECDLVVLPYDSSSESSSAAVRTAIASRTPVAVTPVPIFDDVKDLVFRFDNGDAQSIVNGISWILQNQDARHAIQDRVASWLASNDWTVIAERLQGMLAGLVAQ